MDLRPRLWKINPTNTVFYSPEPRAEVNCFQLNIGLFGLFGDDPRCTAEPVKHTNDLKLRKQKNLDVIKTKQTKEKKRFTDFSTVVKPKIAIDHDMHSAFRTSCFRINFKDGRNFHLNRVARSGEY